MTEPTDHPKHQQSGPYDAILADLEQKKVAIEAAIAGIKLLKGQGLSGPIPGMPDMTALQGAIPTDYFFGMGIADAARKYLAAVKRPKSTREIASALQDGGMTHTSKNFIKTVSTILSQKNQQDGDIIKVGDGWGLAAWYPGRKRGNKE